jgi:hypothetical protein
MLHQLRHQDPGLPLLVLAAYLGRGWPRELNTDAPGVDTPLTLADRSPRVPRLPLEADLLHVPVEVA